MRIRVDNVCVVRSASVRARLLPCVLGALLQITASAQPEVASEQPSSEIGSDFIARGLPRIVYRGGPFLRRPRIATITFEADDPQLVLRLEQFGNTITRTRWWREVTEGYCAELGDCIGEGRRGIHLRLADRLRAAVRDTDIEGLLAREMKGGKLGRADPDLLVLVYLPAGVELSDAFVS